MSVPERFARIQFPLRRRLSLLTTFLVVSAGILAGGALALGAALTDALRAHTVGEAQRTASDYVDRVLRPWLVRGGAVTVTPLGSFPRNGYRVEKLVYESEPGILVPTVLAIPFFLPSGSPERGPAPCPRVAA